VEAAGTPRIAASWHGWDQCQTQAIYGLSERKLVQMCKMEFNMNPSEVVMNVWSESQGRSVGCADIGESSCVITRSGEYPLL